MANDVSTRSGGKFETAYNDQDFIDAIERLGGFADTASVQSEVGCSEKTASIRLEQLAREGLLEKRRVGNSLLWISENALDSSKGYIEYFSDYLGDGRLLREDPSLGIVIAIRKPHSQAILSGDKEIEFRRTPIGQENSPSLGFIYEPSPTKSIVGVFEIESIETHSVEYLCDIGPERTPSTRGSLLDYFEGKDTGTAIFLGDIKSISPPIPLRRNHDGEWLFNPPQDFYYVDPVAFAHSLREDYWKSERPGGRSHELGDFARTS